MKNARDLIFIHLTLVNVLTILFNLIPHLMSSFGERHFLNDLGCKATLYAFRVTRGLSICTTAFLNAFQAITISPRNSTWAWFKSKISICIYPSFFSFWLINMLIYIHVIETVVARRNVTYVGVWHSYIRCQSKPADKHLSKTFICVMVIRDLFFVVLIVCSSVYMVNLLYKHRRRVQHIHSLSLSSQSSPEIKATHTILLLTECRSIPRTHKCGIAFGFYSSDDVTIDEHVEDPEEKQRGVNAGGDFRFKPRPVRITGTDDDGLEGTEESGRTGGKTSGHPVNKIALQPASLSKCFTPKDDMMPGINLNMMVKTLTNVRCMNIKSTGFFR
ncbi:Vomeronasal type-1 receptor 4 [Camelus dromedarius]|uniref:Vomeronasal type-1 receptor n=1 Tax=Camelus dromedarius TaxID=9838 RepID=A0A5N4DQ79_CAMDR|nr:Vomeronasal type-1 receptor 4 [Camelus dromedarius]